jgi:hypothetical protein
MLCLSTVFSCLIAILSATTLVSSLATAETVENAAYRLEITLAGDDVRAVLFDKTLNLTLANGPYLYRAERQRDGIIESSSGLAKASIVVTDGKLTVHGELAGAEIEHTLTLPTDRSIMEEQIVVRNHTNALISLIGFEAGFTLSVISEGNNSLPKTANDRIVAVPFRHRASDPKGHYSEFSIHDLFTIPATTWSVNRNQETPAVPSRHRWSEAWALLHGDHAFGIFSFNQENMVFSVLSTIVEKDRKLLRFGGAVMFDDEPSALTRIAPRTHVDLGTTRYETITGGYNQAAYAYRKMLDEKNCRFPKDFNPPVHWEQLYDMTHAWKDRTHRYSKAIIEREAAKGRDYHCEALYLDPGWDNAFGSFLWGEQWLGRRKQFIDEMRSKYGLEVSLHTPLATWTSHTGSDPDWGPSAVPSYSKEAWRVSPVGDCYKRDMVPAIRGGRRNLALLPAAQANASSLYSGGRMTIHQKAHLNDGWYGNGASWVADKPAAWVEIDLGAEYEISEVRLSNDRLGRYADRGATELKILTATKHNADSQAADWHAVAAYSGPPVCGEKVLSFATTTARWVRIDILKTANDEAPRLDEVEIYDAKPVSEDKAATFAKAVKRRSRAAPPPDPRICLGSKQYLDAAAERMLANCADGVAFLMFDGNSWPEGCDNPSHGHPVPYTKEDHVRANVELAKRVHAKYPNVIVEMHDMLCDGNALRWLTPVYYQYGIPGSFDEHWGFELMWVPMDDIKQGRTLALYYHNMGCNVPVYTHVNIADDNKHCLMLWWYASTCRHLGIGGKHGNPNIVKAQQEAMKWYRAHDRFYKRGDFYGITEEIHLHAIPGERAFTVNTFNLSDQKRVIRGEIDLKSLGLDPTLEYVSAEGLGTVDKGRYSVGIELPPWGTGVAEFRVRK